MWTSNLLLLCRNLCDGLSVFCVLFNANLLRVPVKMADATHSLLAEILRLMSRSLIKTATSQNGDTYSSSDVYIIDRRLYTYMACNC